MLYNAKTLSERLSQHAKDYKQGKTLDFEQIFKDCEAAASTIKSLRANGTTTQPKKEVKDDEKTNCTFG